MSATDRQTSAKSAPLLKPYGGVNASFLQRHAVVIISILAGLICLPYGFYYALWTPWLLVPLLAPLALLLVVTIWALPIAGAVPERTVERLFFVFFAALIVWPNYLAVDLPGLPWITISRLIGTPLVLLFLICVSGSETYRKRIGEVIGTTPLLWKFLAIFVVLQVVSIAFSAHVGESISKFIIHQTNETIIFFVCCYVFRTPGRVERWAALLWAMAVVVGGIGLVEYHEQHVLWAGHIPGFLAVQDESVQRILAGANRSTTGQYRTTSVFSTAIGLAEYLAYALPFILHFAASAKYRLSVRLAAAVTVPVTLIVMLDTDSRLGLLGFFLSLMFYLLFAGILMWRRRRGSIFAPAIVLAFPTLFLMGVVASFTIGRVKAKVWGTGQYEASNQGRMDQVRMGMPKIIDHPFGHGVGTAGDALGYTNLAGTQTIDSYYLAVGMEYGFLGFVVFYGMFVLALYYAIKYSLREKNPNSEFTFLVPISISIIIFLIVKSIFAQDSNHPIIFMMMGIVAAIAWRISKGETGVADQAVGPSQPPPAAESAPGARRRARWSLARR